jgi:hypothetical protein
MRGNYLEYLQTGDNLRLSRRQKAVNYRGSG